MRGLALCLAGAGLIWIVFSSSSALAGNWGEAAGGTVTDPRHVVVELFTSEGCSSCPAADRLLIQLQQSQPVPGAKIIALGEHVDYWNSQGWADPFSSAEFSARQQNYAAIFARDGVYTPQMVVDGHREFVGSDRKEALEAISKSARLPKASFQISRDDGSKATKPDQVTLHVRVDGLDRTLNRQRADVRLAITEDDLESNVLRGENSGRRLQHAAWSGKCKSSGELSPTKSQPSPPTLLLRSGLNGSAEN